MFLKPITVEKNGKDHHYWALVKSVRTARGPRHQTVAYLGELAATDRAGWARLGRALDGGVEPALPLFYLGLALWRTPLDHLYPIDPGGGRLSNL